MAVLLVLALGAIPLHGSILRVGTPAADGSVASPRHPSGWQRYRAPDGAFEIVAPSTPSVTPLTTELGTAHEARFTDGLRVVWSDAPVSTASDDRILSEVVARTLTPLVGLVADEESDLVDAGHPGFGLSLTSQGQHLAVRAFVADGRFFEVIGTAPTGEAADEAESFVRSFVLEL